jgi:exopolyphosphatase
MLNNYLYCAKTNLKNKKTVHAVMGNEAADADSVVSAIAYACFLEKTIANNNETYIPVINICKNDIKLRREILLLLSNACIDIENLFFIDEFDIKKYSDNNKLKIILTDHNKLSWKQENLAKDIEGIIDHHIDENAYNTKNKIIEQTGSCATIVSQIIIEKNPELLTKEFAQMLLSPILLDTSNISPKNSKTTKKDIEVAQYLISKFNIDAGILFYTLHNEKHNISNFSACDILRKDYKEWIMGNYKTGFSSTNIPIEKWFLKEKNLIEVFGQFYTNNSLDIFIIMISYTDMAVFKRELVLFSKNSTIIDKLCSYLQENGSVLEKISIDESYITCSRQYINFFTQKNTAYSRKKLQPVINSFFSELRL